MRESPDTPPGADADEAAAIGYACQAAAMSDGYPVQWADGQRSTLPQHVGESYASRIRDKLLLATNRGATELVADMTGPAWCGQAGVAAVAHAYQRAPPSELPQGWA